MEGLVFEERPRDFAPQTRERSHGFNRARPTPWWTNARRVDSERERERERFRRCALQEPEVLRKRPDVSKEDPDMKITEYLCCALVCMCLLKMANTETSRDKFERQLLDALTTERTMKAKRPFCNAFTGCGRKRSFSASTPTLQDSQDFHVNDNVRLPVSLYRALLNAAKQNTWDAIDREEYDYRSRRMPQVYLPGQMPLRDTLES